MALMEVRQKAKERLRDICRVCRICDGVACAGWVPGIGGVGTGASFQNNVQALARHRLNLRVIHQVEKPQMGLSLFGHQFTLPVLGAAVAGAKLNFRGLVTEEELSQALLLGAKAAGTAGMTGDGPDPALFETGLAAVRAADGIGIPIIKPLEQARIKERIRLAEQSGAMAVGIDIDAAGLINMTRAGKKVGPKTGKEIAEIVASTSLPVIIKGIMTPEDALAVAEAGATALVVSNHGGRALDHTPGTAEVLPRIADAVGERITVLLDGGIRSGSDVLKALALGARAVLVGRPLAIAAFGGGAEGVRLELERLRGELEAALILTGTTSVSQVSREILYRESPVF
ncbi:MAG: alpha-hydroxy-acid oxidizing protein [Firmicutes bacterium]|nr:alpha-hydroxy-acid oxidizing protein [Bacillota bacterium]